MERPVEGRKPSPGRLSPSRPLPPGDRCERGSAPLRGSFLRWVPGRIPPTLHAPGKSSGWSWRSVSQQRFPGRLQRSEAEWKGIRDPAQDSRSAAYSSFRRGLPPEEAGARDPLGRFRRGEGLLDVKERGEQDARDRLSIFIGCQLTWRPARPVEMLFSPPPPRRDQ